MTDAADPVRERLRTAREVRIRTESPSGAVHRTVIWVVVDDQDRILVRSWRGADARWYREATSGCPVALVVDGAEHRVEAIHAADPVRVAACSDALTEKYAGSPSTASMLREEILGTTLELVPIGG